MCPFSEDANLITSLQDELKNLKEEMVLLKSTPVSVPLCHDSTYRAALQNKESSP